MSYAEPRQRDGKAIGQVTLRSHHERAQSLVIEDQEGIKLLTFGGRSIVQGAAVEIMAGLAAGRAVGEPERLASDQEYCRLLARAAVALAIATLSEGLKLDPSVPRDEDDDSPRLVQSDETEPSDGE